MGEDKKVTVRLGDEKDSCVELGRMWSMVKMEKHFPTSRGGGGGGGGG